MNRLVTAQHAERERIARDLHDEIGAEMLGLIASLEATKAKFPKTRKEADFNIRKVRNIMNAIRKISHSIMPEVLSKNNLHDAIAELASRPVDQMRIEFKSNCSEIRFSDEVRIHFYRIVKELITNSLIHGKATKVQIDLHLSESDALLVFYYADNGVGFEVSPTLLINKGIGVMNIATRIKLINGIFEISGVNGFIMRAYIENIKFTIHDRILNSQVQRTHS